MQLRVFIVPLPFVPFSFRRGRGPRPAAPRVRTASMVARRRAASNRSSSRTMPARARATPIPAHGAPAAGHATGTGAAAGPDDDIDGRPGSPGNGAGAPASRNAARPCGPSAPFRGARARRARRQRFRGRGRGLIEADRTITAATARRCVFRGRGLIEAPLRAAVGRPGHRTFSAAAASLKRHNLADCPHGSHLVFRGRGRGTSFLRAPATWRGPAPLRRRGASATAFASGRRRISPSPPCRTW